MSEAIKQYLEAVEKATDFRHGDRLERFLIAEADMHRVARAAMDAADEVRELVELCRKGVVDGYLASSEVDRIRELVREE